MKTLGSLFISILVIGMEWGAAADPLVFGVLETEAPSVMHKRFEPLLENLKKRLGVDVELELAHNRQEVLENLLNGTFDLGCLSSSTYVMAKRIAPKSLQLIAGVERDHNRGDEQMAIVVRKDSPLNTINELRGKRFAFGPYQSPLSYYLPYYLLTQKGILASLKSFDTLGTREESVAKRVIMGSYDAGAVPLSIARLYKKHLKTIARSEVISDSAIVVNRNIDPKVRKLIGSFFRVKVRKRGSRNLSKLR